MSEKSEHMPNNNAPKLKTLIEIFKLKINHPIYGKRPRKDKK